MPARRIPATARLRYGACARSVTLPLTAAQPDRKVTIVFGAPPNASTPVTAPQTTATAASGTGAALLALVATTCPPNYRGANFASDCTSPLAGVSFVLQPEGGAAATATTGADGGASFANLAAGI